MSSLSLPLVFQTILHSSPPLISHAPCKRCPLSCVTFLVYGVEAAQVKRGGSHDTPRGSGGGGSPQMAFVSPSRGLRRECKKNPKPIKMMSLSEGRLAHEWPQEFFFTLCWRLKGLNRYCKYGEGRKAITKGNEARREAKPTK